MLKFIIRLDDVCETMNLQNWIRLENLLDRYSVKPIVGIIPRNVDPKFNWPFNDGYIELLERYQNKGYIIAQHGYEHDVANKSDGEFIGKSKNEQRNMIETGYKLLKEKGLNPICFYTPKHKFDDVTVEVVKELGLFNFISDGYALFPYKYDGVVFFPSIFNSARKILPFGIFTFVYHPNTMTEKEYEHLDKFLRKNQKNFVLDDLDSLVLNAKERQFKPFLFSFLMNLIRRTRRIFKGK